MTGRVSTPHWCWMIQGVQDGSLLVDLTVDQLLVFIRAATALRDIRPFVDENAVSQAWYRRVVEVQEQADAVLACFDFGDET